MSTALILGDLHFPFENEQALALVLAFAKQAKPEIIIQVGDLYDFFAFSKYPRSLNLMSPQHEMDTGREKAERMWYLLRKYCPSSKLVQLTGNHDSRALKRALELNGSLEALVSRDLGRMMGFDGVQTIRDEKEEFLWQGVCFQHGFRKFGEHSRFNQMNTVTGHLHLGGVVWRTNIHGPYYELNAGWLGDKRSPVFSYRSQNKISGTTVGFGLIDEMGPRFVSLE